MHIFMNVPIYPSLYTHHRTVGHLIIDGIGSVLLLNIVRAADKRIETEQ